MNPYDLDIEKLKESKVITDEKELLKLKLTSAFLKAISKMSTDDVLSATGLHKSDLSRLRALNVSRFTIDRIVGFLDVLGFSTKIDVERREAS
jgi:hypothetical protein